MSRRKHRWWPYVLNILNEYPMLCASSDRADIIDARAVDKALEMTRLLEDGQERITIIELVHFKKTHTLGGAADRVGYAYETAKRKRRDFIILVARNKGLKV